jgi:Meckel syndrome type 1 protein
VSETPKKLSLDAVLREWPEEGKAASEWEEMAHRIDERVGSGESGASVAFVSDDNLFADPLGQIEEGGHNHASPPARVNAGETRVSKDSTMTMPADRERDRRSLQDLAKMGSMGGLTPPPASVQAPNSSASGVHRAGEAKGDDSGLINFAAVSQPAPLSAPSAPAPQATPLARAGLFDDEPASVRPGPVSSAPVSQHLQQPAPSIPPFAPASMPPASLHAPASFVQGSMAAASSSQQAVGAMPMAEKKKGNGKVIALVLGGLVAVSSMAAGGFFFMKHRAAEAEASKLAMNTPAATVAPVVAAAPPEVKPAAEPTPAPEATVDPNALPVVAAKPVAKGGTAPVAVAAATKPATKEESAKLSAKDLPTTPAGPGGDLGAAMGKAVGADGKPVDATPAAGSTGPQFAAGTVPQKPSQGAVTGAIGAVLPGARACLGPDDPVSRATITFTSSGTVQSVNVSGGAAGKPAEGCIKAALGKAKVAPFAEATYTAPITIRH